MTKEGKFILRIHLYLILMTILSIFIIAWIDLGWAAMIEHFKSVFIEDMIGIKNAWNSEKQPLFFVYGILLLQGFTIWFVLKSNRKKGRE